MSKQTQRSTADRSNWRYIGLATQIMAYLAGSVWIGFRLDKFFGIFPGLTATLPVAVLVALFYKILRETKK